jgi:hypothetical protein
VPDGREVGWSWTPEERRTRTAHDPARPDKISHVRAVDPDWIAVFGVLVLSHLAGDFLLQTDYQALHKFGGLGRDPASRRALFAHVATYTLAFVPAAIWAMDTVGGVLVMLAAVSLPHLLIDDGRLLRVYIREVKHVTGDPPLIVLFGVDQTLHLLCLAAAALIASF